MWAVAMSRLCTYGMVGKSIFVSVRCAVFAVVIEWIDESRAGEYELGDMKMRRETVKIRIALGIFGFFSNRSPRLRVTRVVLDGLATHPGHRAALLFGRLDGQN